MVHVRYLDFLVLTVDFTGCLSEHMADLHDFVLITNVPSLKYCLGLLIDR